MKSIRSLIGSMDASILMAGIIVFNIISFLVFFLMAQVSIVDVWDIVTSNYSFWIVIIAALGIGVIQKIRNKDTFMWAELPIQLFVSASIIFAFSSLMYSASTDLVDKEIWNSYVTKAEYYEAWTERVSYKCHCRKVGCRTCGSGSSKHECGCTEHCDTCYRNEYRPPYWEIAVKNDGTHGISQPIYAKYVKLWGGESKTILHRSGQVSVGDGNKYHVMFKNKNDVMVPASSEHVFTNYLKASKSTIRKNSGVKLKYKNMLRDYPKVFNGEMGPIDIRRVVSSGASIPGGWINKLNDNLGRSLGLLGERKQVNIIVYLVGTKDQNFYNALREHWIDGKKNDVVIVIGVSSFPNIDWVSIMSWTKSEVFKVTLKNRIYDMKTIENADMLSSIISDQIGKSDKNGGFIRLKSDDLEYLKSDIELSWWQHLLVIIIGLLAALITSWSLINNDWRKVQVWRRWR